MGSCDLTKGGRLIGNRGSNGLELVAICKCLFMCLFLLGLCVRSGVSFEFCMGSGSRVYGIIKEFTFRNINEIPLKKIIL